MKARTKMFLAALALLGAVWGFSLLLTRNFSHPNAELFTEMAHSVAAESLDESTVLPGGTVQQPAPEGTLYRGEIPFPFAPGVEEALRAGREWKMPADVLASDRAVPRGQVVFRNSCSTCHGLDGLGNAALAAAGFPKPPPLTAEHAKGLPDGQLYHIFMTGQGAMPPHADHVSPADRWPLVRYIRKLQGGAP